MIIFFSEKINHIPKSEEYKDKKDPNPEVKSLLYDDEALGGG